MKRTHEFLEELKLKRILKENSLIPIQNLNY
jgi:hypothetical protein